MGRVGRLGTVVAAAGLLLAGAVPLTTTAGAAGLAGGAPVPPAAASDSRPAVTMTVQLGYDGAVPPNGWTPIAVTVHNGGGAVNGAIVVWTGQAPSTIPIASGIPAGSRLAQSLAQNPQPSIATRHPVALAAGASVTYTTYLLDSLQEVSAEFLTGAGRAIASAQASPGDPRDGPQVAVLSDDSQALSDVAAITLPGPAVRINVLHLTSKTLPALAPALRAFSLLVIDGTATLRAAQRNALFDYVATGGTLLVAGGSGGAANTTNLPTTLQAFTPTGTETEARLPGLAAELGVDDPGQPVVVDTGTPHGTTLLAEGSDPILVRRQVGTGQVLFSTIELGTAAPPWPGQQALLEEVLLRAILPGSISAGWALAPNPGFTASGAWLREALANLPDVPLGSLWLPAVLLALYVAICGPGVLWLLRRRHRAELAWAVIPIVAVLVAGAVAAGTGWWGSSSALTARVAVVHLNPGTNVSYVESAVGVYSRNAGSSRVVDASQPPGAALVGALASLSRAGLAPPTPVIDSAASAGAVQLTSPKPQALASFGEESIQPAHGSVAVKLTQSGDLLSGSITSHLPGTLTGVKLVDGTTVKALGTLRPGRPAKVDLRLVPAAGGPGALLPGLGPPDDAPGDPTGPIRSAQRQAVLYDILGTNVETVPPMLMGWLAAPSPGLRVDGKRSQPAEFDAVVMPLQPTVVGPQLVAGEVTPHVVGLSGSVSPYVTVAGDRTFGNLGPGSGVTFELAVPAGVDPHELALTLQGADPASGITASVFDPASEAWEPLATPAGQPSPLPSASDVSGTGLLRVRVSAVATQGARFAAVQLTAG